MLLSAKVGVLVALAAGAGGVSLCGVCGGGQAAAGAVEQAADTVVARFAVSGMTCGSCATTARVALRRIPGVYDARVSYDSATAVVRYDPSRVTPAQIAEQLERRTGYRAHLVAESPRAPGRSEE